MKIKFGAENNDLQKALRNQKTRQALGDLIAENEWDIFVTVTFRMIADYEYASKRLKKFLKYRLNTNEEIYFEDEILCFVIYEQVKSYLGVHIHALIKGIHPSKSEALQKRCCSFFGNSKVEPYRKNDNGRWYLANKFGRSLVEFDTYLISRFKY